VRLQALVVEPHRFLADMAAMGVKVVESAPAAEAAMA
jgi:hypothetical protein